MLFFRSSVPEVTLPDYPHQSRASPKLPFRPDGGFGSLRGLRSQRLAARSMIPKVASQRAVSYPSSAMEGTGQHGSNKIPHLPRMGIRTPDGYYTPGRTARRRGPSQRPSLAIVPRGRPTVPRSGRSFPIEAQVAPLNRNVGITGVVERSDTTSMCMRLFGGQYGCSLTRQLLNTLTILWLRSRSRYILLLVVLLGTSSYSHSNTRNLKSSRVKIDLGL